MLWGLLRTGAASAQGGASLWPRPCQVSFQTLQVAKALSRGCEAELTAPRQIPADEQGFVEHCNFPGIHFKVCVLAIRPWKEERKII